MTGQFPIDANDDGICSGSEMAGFDQTFRRDANDDGVCNNADASTTDTWLDDTLPTDALGVATPIIGGGFSVDRPLDIRTGGGDDEVQYNVNAPVSIDGGTGIDKLIVLATEFADDILVTAKGIFGAGLNVRHERIEIVEIDGLEGDDEFFVQSTAFGVAYRFIGGLGSDSFNVAGDVVEDIVTRDIDGESGSMAHRALSDDFDYDAIPIEGVDVRVATTEIGKVIITETGGGTGVSENGAPVAGSTNIDSYSVKLAAGSYTGTPVYVTVSAARSPQEEIDDDLDNPAPLTDGPGDTIWLCTGASATDCDELDEFQEHYVVDGVTVDEAGRAFVLTFTDDVSEQFVYVWAVDTVAGSIAVDDRSEGERVVVVNHSVKSDDPSFDNTLVRNVEVTVRDNETPDVVITEVEPGTTIEDGRTIVVEGTREDGTPQPDPVGGIGGYTGLLDTILVQLGREIAPTDEVVVRLVLDDASGQAIRLAGRVVDPLAATLVSRMVAGATVYEITFDGTNWNRPVGVDIIARDDFLVEDPQTAVVTVELVSSDDPTFVFPNLRSGLDIFDVEVIDDDSPAVLVTETGDGTLVERNAGAAGSDNYFLRLTQAPTSEVAVSLIGDGLADVVEVDGVVTGPRDYQDVGVVVPYQAFTGNVTVAGNVISRAPDSDLGSWITDGISVGARIRISIDGTGHDLVVTALDDQDLTVAPLPGQVLPDDGDHEDITVGNLDFVGEWSGEVDVTSGGGIHRIRRIDGSGWLADGFVEGQWIRFNDDPTLTFKIAIIRGANATFDDILELTQDPANPAPPVGVQVAKVDVVAAVAVFTVDDWFVQHEIVLEADDFFEVPLVRTGAKTYPASRHVLSRIRGPISIEGGVGLTDRSLQRGVKLPGELDGDLLGIGPQAPESQQIDVINVYNDDSVQDGTGLLTSTNLSGFGMAPALEFDTGGAPTNAFGEPARFPGGITFGTLTFENGMFTTDAAKSTIEVLNIMLGQGNDHLDIQGTLDPDLTREPTAPDVLVDGGATPVAVAPWNVGGTDIGVVLTGPDWAAEGFLAGHLVFLDDGDQTDDRDALRSWRVVEIDGNQMTLRGDVLPSGGFDGRVFVSGRHGGLTVVHGGGNRLLETTGIFDFASAGDNRITRTDGLAWSVDGFGVGDLVEVGDGVVRTITAFADAPCPVADPWASCGVASVMILDGAPFATLGVAIDARVFQPLGDMPAVIDGDTALTGGDHIIVCNPDAVDADGVPVPCGDVLGGPGSPLVVYGDTTQDGLWYSGDPGRADDGHEFGEKPFNPFPLIPDDQNEDDEWFFGLANPFKRSGHDVIDATGLFADLRCGPTDCDLPTVGITAYGGAGNDTILGSQTGDHLAGGSGDDLIEGNRGVDHIYGDSGVTVDIFTRELVIPTVNTASTPNADLLAVGDDVLRATGAGTVLGGPAHVYDSFIVGDHGRIEQLTEEPNTPLPGLQEIQTTLTVLEIRTEVFESGGDDLIIGDLGKDHVLAGRGDDRVETGDGDDMITGDNGLIRFTLIGADLESVADLVLTLAPHIGGDDVLLVGDDDDVVLAGEGKDLVNHVPVGDPLSDPANNAGNEPTKVGSDTGDDIVVGDNGIVMFSPDTGVKLLTLILTGDISELGPGLFLIEPPQAGDDDWIFTDAGDDIVFGANGRDWIDTGLTGDDLVVGDHARADFALRPVGAPIKSVLTFVSSTYELFGDEDVILVGDGDDIVIGGLGSDHIGYVPVGAVASDPVNNAGNEPTQVDIDTGDDLVIGDHGSATFDTSIDVPLLTRVTTTNPTVGSADFIFTGQAGDDIVLAGAGGDWVDTGQAGDDIVISDHGWAEFNIEPTDSAVFEESKVSVVREVRSTDPAEGGDDVVLVRDGDDIVIAGFGQDLVNYVPVDSVASDPANNTNANGGPAEPTQVGAFDTGDDIVVGDNGFALFDTSIDLPLLTHVSTTDAAVGDVDFVFTGDAGDDVVLAGAGGDWVDTGQVGDDLVFGDHGFALFTIEPTDFPALELIPRSAWCVRSGRPIRPAVAMTWCWSVMVTTSSSAARARTW